jgi:NAD(P)-dependent dehydrogenase (short-subunit alcohol dehydrogenase family)
MSSHDLNGKIAIVTGGTRGLGRAIALELARLGATVAMNYRRDEASAAKTFDEVRGIAPRSILIKADLEDEAQVRAMVTKVAADRERGRDRVQAAARNQAAQSRSHFRAERQRFRRRGPGSEPRDGRGWTRPDDFRHRFDS